MEPLTILIVDERRAAARALARNVERLGYFVEVAYDADSARALAAKAQVALLTLHLNAALDAPELCARLRRGGSLAVVFVVERADDVLLHQARHASPSGYVFRPVTQESLRAAIELARPLPAARESMTRPLRRNTPMRQLSPRELQIFEALARGERPPSIGQSFFISVHTVRRHVQAIFRKLNVHSQVELMRAYAREGEKPPRSSAS